MSSTRCCYYNKVLCLIGRSWGGVCVCVWLKEQGTTEESHTFCFSQSSLWHRNYASVSKNPSGLAPDDAALHPGWARARACVWEIRWCFSSCQGEIPPVLSKRLRARKHRVKNVNRWKGWTNEPCCGSVLQPILSVDPMQLDRSVYFYICCRRMCVWKPTSWYLY